MDDDNGIMINRLVVLIQIILVPIYFIFFTSYWHTEIELFFDILVSKYDWTRIILKPWFVNFLIDFGITIVFSLPWVLISILRATRIADAYMLMGRALGKVRIDQKIFYGLNAAFVMIFLVLPFGSPLITIIGIFIFIKIISHKIGIGKLSKLVWIIPSIIIAIIPAVVAFAFYINYISLWDKIFQTWLSSIGTIFGIGLCLAIAISIGNFILFLYEGRAKYNNENIPYEIVFVVKMVLLGVLLLIYFNNGIKIVNYVNYLAAILAFLEMGLRKLHDMPSEGSSKFGVVMVIVFSLVNMLTNYLGSILSIAQTVVILISGLIFFILFTLSYKYADDPELIY